MKRTPYIRITLRSICLVIVFLLNGCAVFRPVGHAISQGYENSVSYFNGYYNAKWLFDEAEDEILVDALAKRGQTIPTGTAIQIPASAKEKLLKVIDKCSNILAFHSTSTLVDDALILIGKSFFYQAEYLKAERKFSELLTQYPNSSLVLEAQIWYALTEEKLEKIEAGISMCESTITAAQVNGETRIEAQAHRILSRLYLQDKLTDKAVLECEKEIALLSDDNKKAEAYINLANIYFSEGQYEKAAEIYLQVEGFTSDIYSNYYSKVQAAIAYREIKEYKKGLTLVNAMIENFRYKTFLPNILFERAFNYVASGRINEAIDEYIYIDTTYKTSEYAPHSAYELGVLYEKEIGDYQSALKYYAQVNLTPEQKFVIDGRLKFTALTRYFAARKKLETADSLLFVLRDTTREATLDSLLTFLSDTSMQDSTSFSQLKPSVLDSTKSKNAITVFQHTQSRLDSLKILRSRLDSIQHTIGQASSRHSRIKADSLTSLRSYADSLQQRIFLVSSQLVLPGADSVLNSRIRTVSQPVLISADSLDVLKSIAAQDLGDVFYTELVVPDSAFFWYEKSLTWNYSPIRSPRILFILAELTGTNVKNKDQASEKYYARLSHDFPESIYTEEARRILGKENYVKQVDSAAIYYEEAEKHIDAKQHAKAVKKLRSIAQSYAKSPFAAKSEYAIAWIYENHLSQPDSALAQYKYVKKKYTGTKYAIAAENRSTRIVVSDSVKTDTTKIHVVKTDTSKIQSTAKDSIKLSTMKMDMPVTNRGIDTTKSGMMDTTKSKFVKIDTSGTNSSPVNKKFPNPAGTRKDTAVARKRMIE
jgi:tetratricopeptide (TPR) repeat protein